MEVPLLERLSPLSPGCSSPNPDQPACVGVWQLRDSPESSPKERARYAGDPVVRCPAALPLSVILAWLVGCVALGPCVRSTGHVLRSAGYPVHSPDGYR